MHGRLTEVGEIGQPVVPINRGDGDDIVELIIGGISGKEVVVESTVLGRHNKQHALLSRAIDGVEQRLSERTSAPTVVHYLSSFVDGVVNASNRVAEGTETLRAQKLATHQSNVPRDTDVRMAIVGGRADGAGDMGAVVIVVERIARPGDRVDPEYIVHKAVAVVINTVAGHFIGIAPHLVRQFLMGITNAGINNRHDHVG